MPSVLPIGAVLPSLALAALAAAAVAVAVATAFYFLRARLYERLEDSLPASGGADLHALGERIESLVGQQQLHGETQRQILSQKLDAIGQRFDEQRHAVDGLRHEMRHEAQRRDDELADIRHQIAAIQQAAPALAAPAPRALGDGTAPGQPPVEAPSAPPPAPPPVAVPSPSGFEAPVFAAPSFEAASFATAPLAPAPFEAAPFEPASFVTAEPPPVPAPEPLAVVPAFEAPVPTPAPALDLPPGVTVERVSDAPPVDPFALPFEVAAPAPLLTPLGAPPVASPAPPVAPVAPPVAPVAPPADPFGFAFEDPFATAATAPPVPVAPPVAPPPPLASPAPVVPAPMPLSDLVPMAPPPAPQAPALPTVAWAVEPAPVAPPAAPVVETAWVARPDRDEAAAPVPMPDAPPVEASPVDAPAAEAAPEPEPFVIPEGADDLTVISTVDAVVQNALYLAGVNKLDEIARWGRSDARRVASQVGISEDTIMTQWVFEAQAALFDQYTRQAS